MNQPRVIFVFGSNLAGQHAGGAARDAEQYWGAVTGLGVGPAGESYAIPTIGRDMQPLTIGEIAQHAADFIDYAGRHPERIFYVTPIGCGIAGFFEHEIAPLFITAPSNVQLPNGWRA